MQGDAGAHLPSASGKQLILITNTDALKSACEEGVKWRREGEALLTDADTSISEDGWLDVAHARVMAGGAPQQMIICSQ